MTERTSGGHTGKSSGTYDGCHLMIEFSTLIDSALLVEIEVDAVIP